MTESHSHILQAYLRRLTRLSSNNRSICLLRLAGDHFLDVHQLEGIELKHSFQVIESLLAGRILKICPVSDSRIPAINQLSQRLKKLARTDAFLFDEHGSRDLHLGWPFVRGKFNDHSIVSAPLIFFPVSLRAEHHHWKLYLRKEAGIVFNKHFLLAYYHHQQLTPDEELLDHSFEEMNPDSTVFRTELYQLLKDRLEIRFTPDLYHDSLQSFETITRAELDARFEPGIIKVFHQAVLGIFPQADSRLVPDYLYMINEGKVSHLEFFFRSQQDLKRDEAGVVAEEKIFAPFFMDTWQEEAFCMCKQGHSLVVHGPPGTGKSQLIANLVADALATGRRVLVVSQKRVALDVVHDRLRTAGLDVFVARIHDFRHDLGELYAQIARHIESIDDYQALNRTVDAIRNERSFVQLCRSIDRMVEEGEDYRKALLNREDCGLSPKELYLTSGLQEEHISLRHEFHHFHFSFLQPFLTRLRTYVAYASRFEQPDYPLIQRKSFARLTAAARLEMEEAIRSASAGIRNLSERLKGITEFPCGFAEAENLWNQRGNIQELIGLLTDEYAYAYFRHMASFKYEEVSLLWLQNMERLCLNCFDYPGMEASLPDAHMGAVQVALQERMQARKSLVRFIRWEFFSDRKFFLKRILVANNLPYTKTGLAQLEQRVDNRLNLMHHITALRQVAWITDLPDQYDKRIWKKWFERQLKAVRAKLLFSSLRELRNMEIARLTHPDFIRLMWDLLDELQQFEQQKEAWLAYLSPAQLTALSHSPGVAVSWTEHLKSDFENLCAFDALRESMPDYEIKIIRSLFEKLQRWDVKAFEQRFQNSLRLAWIEHLESKYPILRLPSTLRMEHLRQELRQAVTEKKKIVLEMIKMRARELTYAQVRYNRLQHRITYRDLLHQVSKKRRRWPLRKLIAAFTDELFQLVPCWMASPEAVSAVFPMQQMFDLVIFDEASQCFAEHGLPAMYRGRQILIAGDPRQLQPFDLYQVRWKQEDEEDPDLEVESLLDLAMRYLPVIQLRGHYRSQHPGLIAFSNHHFYNNRLAMLPHISAWHKPDPPLLYHKVDGVWQDQCNETEANEVVEWVISLTEKYPTASLGVVTFNALQQELILDKIATAIQGGAKVSPTLFVKNIENIQGDERDIIIFSTGYAPDNQGKLRLQFGSLNLPGGENRLNVAITRARKQIVVVTSIWPEQLKTAGLKNKGPKLLKDYLAFVLHISREPGNWQVYTTMMENDTVASQELTFELAHSLKNYLIAEQVVRNVYHRLFPYADLLVETDSQSGIVQTDDDYFASASSPKGPWVYVPLLYQEKEWPWIQVDSRNWWSNREAVYLELKKFAFALNEPAPSLRSK